MNIPTDNLIFIIPVSTGLIFVIAGFVMLMFPPQKINNLYGYRSSRSKKSQESWDYAQKYSSKELIKFGVLLALSGLLGFIFQPIRDTAMIIGLGLVIITVIVLIIRVESAIKNKFKSE